MDEKEIENLSTERQKFQMKKKGMEDISSSINNVSKSVEQLANKLDPKEIGDGATFIVKGLKGDKGEKGEKGDKGDKGDKGNDGKSIKGDKGDKGEQGIPGKKGVQGLKGDKGEPGKDGRNGIDGKDGSPDTPDEIVSKLQTVKKQWLSIEAIDGDFNTKVTKVINQLGTTTGITEAPTDGNQYARKDGDWTIVTGGSGSGVVESIVAGTGISVDDTDPANPVITNTAPDQTVSITAGTNIDSVTGTYPNFTINASTQSGTTDEKVKYDAGDPTAGYVADKIISGDGISVAEGTGGNENKLVITNTDKGSDVDLSGLVPYTGATGDVSLGLNSLTGNTIYGNGIQVGISGGFYLWDGDINEAGKFRANISPAGISDDRFFTLPDTDGIIALTTDIPDVSSYLTDAPSDGSTYGRKNGAWEAVVGGSGISRSIIVTSGSGTMGGTAQTDYVYLVAGAHTMTLPTAVSNTNRYTVKNNHSASITVDTTSSQTIDGTLTISINPQSSVDIISNNTNWFII